MDENVDNINTNPGGNKFKNRLASIQPKQLVLPLIIFILFVGSVVGVINYQKKVKQNAAPTVEITKPAEGAVLEEAQIVVEGNTSPDINVSVNEKEVKSDSKGHFAGEVALEPGENTLTVIAVNANDKETVVERKVTRGAKQATPATPAPAAEAGEEVATEETPQAAQPTAGAGLSSAGPETLWIPEITALSMAGAGWYASRKKLAKSLRK